MDANYISRFEHEEFSKKIDAEEERQNRRIALLEENIREINTLTVSVEKMAVNMGNMLDELKRQGERLGKLEQEPAETSRQIKLAIITSIIGTVVGAVATAALMIL